LQEAQRLGPIKIIGQLNAAGAWDMVWQWPAVSTTLPCWCFLSWYSHCVAVV
jgi:hypothetical protein